MELAAGQLERLQDRHDLLDAGDRLQGLDLQLVLVADDADDRPRDALAQVGREAQGLDPLEDVLDHLGRRMRLQYDDHRGSLVGSLARRHAPRCAKGQKTECGDSGSGGFR